MRKMVIFAFGVPMLTGAAIHAATTTGSSRSRLFEFKFEANKPLIYAVENKTRQTTDLRSGQRSSLTSTTVDTRYKVKLTGVGTNRDGTTAVYYEPFDFEQDVHTLGREGEMDTTVRGLTIVGKQNGVVVVDTKKGIGQSEAQKMKLGIYPHLLVGYFDFEPTGHIKRFEGSLPFQDTWRNTLKYNMNLFYIVFPTNAIAVHDTWTNYYSIKTSGPMTYDGDGIVQRWSYVRNPDEAATNGSVACFSLYMSDHYKDLNGYLDQLGQQTGIDVTKHTDSMNTTFHFDPKRGCLISMNQSGSAHNDISWTIQGNPAEGHNDSDTEITVTRISP